MFSRLSCLAPQTFNIDMSNTVRNFQGDSQKISIQLLHLHSTLATHPLYFVFICPYYKCIINQSTKYQLFQYPIILIIRPAQKNITAIVFHSFEIHYRKLTTPLKHNNKLASPCLFYHFNQSSGEPYLSETLTQFIKLT